MDDIKLIGLDLDGTLLNAEKRVSKRNIQVLRKCLGQGLQIILVSGRPYCFTRMIADSISREVEVIAANGGIYEIGNRCVEYTLEQEALMKAVEIIERSGVCAFFKGKQEFYTHESYDERFLYDHMNHLFSVDTRVQSFTNLPWDVLRHQVHDIQKVLVYAPADRLRIARREVEGIEQLTLTDYQDISFDINARGVNKGMAIREVLASKNLMKENFLAIGDGNNDISMFDEAGFTIAMGNASQTIQDYCDTVTDSYLDDGVASGIEKVLAYKGF